MLIFNPAKLAPVALGSLAPGQLFYLPVRGVSTLAIMVKFDGGRIAWLNLTGPNAFQFAEERTSHEWMVYRAPCAPGEVRMKIDFASAYDLDDRNSGGLIAVGHRDGPRIAGNWADHDDRTRESVRAGLLLRDWSYTAGDAPQLLLHRWSLGYVDETTSWVELIRSPERAEDRKVVR